MISVYSVSRNVMAFSIEKDYSTLTAKSKFVVEGRLHIISLIKISTIIITQTHYEGETGSTSLAAPQQMVVCM